MGMEWNDKRDLWPSPKIGPMRGKIPAEGDS